MTKTILAPLRGVTVRCFRETFAAEIAEALALSKRTITHRLSKLVEAGQVVRIGKPRSPKQRYCLA